MKLSGPSLIFITLNSPPRRKLQKPWSKVFYHFSISPDTEGRTFSYFCWVCASGDL